MPKHSADFLSSFPSISSVCHCQIAVFLLPPPHPLLVFFSIVFSVNLSFYFLHVGFYLPTFIFSISRLPRHHGFPAQVEQHTAPLCFCLNDLTSNTDRPQSSLRPSLPFSRVLLLFPHCFPFPFLFLRLHHILSSSFPRFSALLLLFHDLPSTLISITSGSFPRGPPLGHHGDYKTAQ